MTFLRRLFSRNTRHDPVPPEAGHRLSDRHAGGAQFDDVYSCLRETRPYVIAMREVAADAHWAS